jgi:hypothetical protein
MVSIHDISNHPAIFPMPTRLRRENHWPSSCWTICVDCSPQELWPLTIPLYLWHANDQAQQSWLDTQAIVARKHLSVALDSAPPQLVDNIACRLLCPCKPTHCIGEALVQNYINKMHGPHLVETAPL